MKKRLLSSITALCLGMTMVAPTMEVNAQEQETRAAWISTVHNIDFPKTKNNVTAQKNEYIAILDKLQDVGMNTVVVQVRPKADALYESKINPWSDVLTGVQGKNPGYDPLKFMLEEAHKRGMEFHAWLNPYRVTTSGTDVNALSSTHPARKNPSMVFAYNGALYYDPASKVVQQHIADSVKEIVQKYNVDAIHFDDYFYPEKYPLPAGEGKDGPVANQRRQNVNDMVSLVSKTIKATNPKVKFGISPIGIWKNNYPDKTGSATRGNESYYSVFADTRTWIRNGWIDYVVPQIYWEIGHSAADYKTLVEWWSNEVNGTGVDLYIGQGIYKPEVAREIGTQLELNKKFSNVKGSIFFTTKDIISNLENNATTIKNFYKSNPTLPGDTSSNNGKLNAEIITYAVNLRPNPDYSNNIICTINVGEKVELLSIEGEFAKIKYNGHIGYVMAKYVRELSSNVKPTPPPVEVPENKPEKPTEPEVKPPTKPEKPTEPEVKPPVKPEKPAEPEVKPPAKPEKPVVTTKVGTVIDATVLNVRSGAGTSHSIVAKLKKGDRVTVLETKNGWNKVKMSNGKTGWVSSKYLKITTTTTSGGSNSSGSSSTKKTGKVIDASVLNVRKGPSTSYAIVTKLNKGATVEVLEQKSGWSKVKTSNGKTGWVSSKYLKITTTTTSGGSNSGGNSNANSGSNNTSTTKKETGKVIDATVLNVRKGPSTSYAIVTKIKKGATVEILEKKNGWYRIKVSTGQTGWVSGDYIKLSSNTTSQNNKPASTKKKTVTVATLNVRKGPSTSYAIVTKLKKNATVTVLESKSGWNKVKTSSGATGWASAQYLK